jgi:hypothetical protein
MLAGMNTDVPFGEALFHVQTEFRSTPNPRIETLIYQDGRIIETRKTPHSDMSLSGAGASTQLLHALRWQHARAVSDAEAGMFLKVDHDSDSGAYPAYRPSGKV